MPNNVCLELTKGQAMYLYVFLVDQHHLLKANKDDTYKMLEPYIDKFEKSNPKLIEYKKEILHPNSDIG